MLAVNDSTLINNLNYYLDMTADDIETVMVTRENEKNVVFMSLESYNRLMKELKNAQYLKKLEESLYQLESGNGQLHELIETDGSDE